MSGTTPQVWMMTSDGCGLIRADAIVVVQLRDGKVIAQLSDAAQAAIPLAVDTAGASMPADFHRQMIRTVAELADASGAQFVRAHHDDHGWRWVTEPL
jgi:hypothetical protein